MNRHAAILTNLAISQWISREVTQAHNADDSAGRWSKALLPSAQYLNHAAMVRGWRGKWDAAVSDFAAAYPQLREDARRALNGMYRAEDYPDEIAEYFALTVRYQPVPDAEDFRLAIPAAELSALKAEAQSSVEAAMARAQSDIKERLRDSLIENARELAALVPRLLPDASISALAQGLGELAQANPDTLRRSSHARQSAADAAARLLADRGPA
jgi:hypothetical protein